MWRNNGLQKYDKDYFKKQGALAQDEAARFSAVDFLLGALAFVLFMGNKPAFHEILSAADNSSCDGCRYV